MTNLELSEWLSIIAALGFVVTSITGITVALVQRSKPKVERDSLVAATAATSVETLLAVIDRTEKETSKNTAKIELLKKDNEELREMINDFRSNFGLALNHIAALEQHIVLGKGPPPPPRDERLYRSRLP